MSDRSKSIPTKGTVSGSLYHEGVEVRAEDILRQLGIINDHYVQNAYCLDFAHDYCRGDVELATYVLRSGALEMAQAEFEADFISNTDLWKRLEHEAYRYLVYTKEMEAREQRRPLRIHKPNDINTPDIEARGMELLMLFQQVAPHTYAALCDHYLPKNAYGNTHTVEGFFYTAACELARIEQTHGRRFTYRTLERAMEDEVHRYARDHMALVLSDPTPLQRQAIKRDKELRKNGANFVLEHLSPDQHRSLFNQLRVLKGNPSHHLQDAAYEVFTRHHDAMFDEAVSPEAIVGLLQKCVEQRVHEFKSGIPARSH